MALMGSAQHISVQKLQSIMGKCHLQWNIWWQSSWKAGKVRTVKFSFPESYNT